MPSTGCRSKPSTSEGPWHHSHCGSARRSSAIWRCHEAMSTFTQYWTLAPAADRAAAAFVGAFAVDAALSKATGTLLLLLLLLLLPPATGLPGPPPPPPPPPPPSP